MSGIAWAIGLFEGEGCMSHLKGKPHQPIVTCTSTDHDVLERFSAIVGRGIVDERRRPPQYPHWKRTWVWRATGDDAVEVMGVFLPLLCERRAARARQLLTARAAHIAAVTYERVCLVCELPFQPSFHAKSADTTVCSPECKAEHNRRYMRERHRYLRRQSA